MIPTLSDAEGNANSLKALLGILAYHIDECDNKVALASLSRQYQSVLEKVVALESEDSGEADGPDLGGVEAAIANVVNLR